MRNYLLYSSSAHFLILLGFFLVMARNPLQAKKAQTYYIDFVGPSTVTTVRKAAQTVEAAQIPSKAKTEYAEEEDFAGGLPKPSVLSGSARLIDQKDAGDPDSRNSASLSTDAENFPYPWYIAQVREALWNAWTGKMPSGGDLRCTVKFTIKRDGGIKGASVEKSSGNRLFDNAAENSAQSAAPFPPLPDDFFEESLTVHVEFKAGE